MFGKILQNIKNVFQPKKKEESKPIQIPPNLKLNAPPPQKPVTSTSLSLAGAPPANTVQRPAGMAKVNIQPPPQIRTSAPTLPSTSPVTSGGSSGVGTGSSGSPSQQNYSEAPTAQPKLDLSSRINLPSAQLKSSPLGKTTSFTDILKGLLQKGAGAAGSILGEPGTPVRQKTGQLIEDISQLGAGPSGTRIPETGISEAFAGAPTQRSGENILKELKLPPIVGTAEANFSPATAYGSPSGAPQMSALAGTTVSHGGYLWRMGSNGKWQSVGSAATREDPSIKTGLTDIGQKETTIRREAEKLLNQPEDSSIGIGEDTYGLFDEPYQEILSMYNNDQISAEEFEQKRAQLEEQQTKQIYDELIGQQKKLIPEYESYLTRDIEKLQGLTKEAKEEGETRKGEISNKYGEAIRRIATNRNIDTSRLKNIFSALGTAESSAFLNKATELEQTAGSEISATEREQLGKIADIDKQITKLDVDTTASIKDLVADKNRKVQAVLDNVNLSESEKKRELQKVNFNLTAALRDVQSTFNNNKAQLIQLQKNAVDTRKNILLQGQVDENLINRQAALDEKRAGIFQDLDFDLQELGRPYTGMAKNAARTKIKSIYPQLSELIDGVYDGRRPLEELKQAIQAIQQPNYLQ